MPRLKVWVWWIAVSCVLALLLMRTDSDVALGLPPVAAFLVWFVQVALGLGVAIAATWWLGGFRAIAAVPAVCRGAHRQPGVRALVAGAGGGFPVAR
jgi:hypothetical protein